MYNLSQRSKDRLKGVHPFIIELLEKGIVNSPYDFGIPEDGGLRTTERQQYLFSIGRTIEVGTRKPVTYTDGVIKKSNHQAKEDGYGHAFDIYIFDNGKADWNIEKLGLVAQHLKIVASNLAVQRKEWNDIYLSYGGDWKNFKDYPHFEIKFL